MRRVRLYRIVICSKTKIGTFSANNKNYTHRKRSSAIYVIIITLTRESSSQQQNEMILSDAAKKMRTIYLVLMEKHPDRHFLLSLACE